MEHLAVDFGLIPVFISLVVGGDRIKDHAGRVKHVGHRASAILATICVGHIADVMRIDGVATCPRVTEAHSQVVKRVNTQDCVSLDGHRTQRIRILCKFLIVILGTVEAEVCADLIDNLSCLLARTDRNFGDNLSQIVCGVFRHGSLCVVAQIPEEVRNAFGQTIVEAGSVFDNLRQILSCLTHCTV
jgi:hypothetical protein